MNVMVAKPIQRSADHQYTYAGTTYPGVTGILKVVDKSDALMSWAARQTAEAALAQLDNLLGLRATVGPEGVIRALTARSGWKRDEAAQLGTDVHALADRVARGEPDIIVPENVRQHVHNYAEWWATSGWTIRATEAMLVNTVSGYGGTLDLLCRDRDGRTVLADIKTGRGIYKEAVLQLAAYGDAELIQTQDGELYPMPKVDRYAILHVTAEGVREAEVSVGVLERMAWGACIDLHQWMQTMKGKRL